MTLPFLIHPHSPMSQRDPEERARRRAERQRLLMSGPPSPCISVCQIDPDSGYCLGCQRDIDEIRNWIISTPEERQRILDRLPMRRALMNRERKTAGTGAES